MCFTPTISLLTAIFEFGVATFLLFYYKKSSFNKAIIILIYLLGLYQLTEYMLCSSNSPFFWAKIGFVTYTFLPAIGLNFCYDYVKRKYNSLFIFIIPTIFSLFALLNKNFIIETLCENYFVVVRHMFFNNLLLIIMYLMYYFGFIILISYLLIQHYKKLRSKIKKEIDIDVLIGIFISLVPAILLLFIFPALIISFPSIYCKFAVLFTIAATIAFHLDKKSRKGG